jgi:hypothetical protein
MLTESAKEKHARLRSERQRNILARRITELENQSASMLPLPINHRLYPAAFANLSAVNLNLKRAYCNLEYFDA